MASRAPIIDLNQKSELSIDAEAQALSRPAPARQLPCENPSRAFGLLLRQVRRKAGLTQMDLAFAVGVSTRHANFLERGRSRPSRTMVRRFCEALDLDTPMRDRMMLAAGYAPERLGSLAADGAAVADLHHSFAMALAIRQQSSIASVLSLGSLYLRELGLEDVLAAGYTKILTNVALLRAKHEAVPAASPSEEVAARRLAQQIICDSVHETLKRLSGV